MYPITNSATTMSGINIPFIWSAKTIQKFYAVTVFGEIANTDYEGEISAMGDKITITTIPDIVIRDYTIDQELEYTKPVNGKVELLIDKGHYYAIPYNDVEKKQSKINFIDKWTDDASQQMGIAIDRSILSTCFTGAATANKGLTAGAISGGYDMGVAGTPLVVTKTNVLEVIADMGSVLDEQNKPATDRFCVIPSIIKNLVKKSDLKNVSITGDAKSTIRNGKIGDLDDFTVYTSNNVNWVMDTTHRVFNCVAGHKSALTFASQLTENEVITNPKDFGKLMRGLQVYGWKVVDPTSLVHGYFEKG